MDHSFNATVASEFSVDVSVFLQSIAFWTKTNAANERNFFEGRFWTYNTLCALGKLFPYYTIKQLRRIIKQCVDAGLLHVGNFNKSAYDRTKWYSLSDRALSYYPETLKIVNDFLICPNGQIKSSERAHLYQILTTDIKEIYEASLVDNFSGEEDAVESEIPKKAVIKENGLLTNEQQVIFDRMLAKAVKAKRIDLNIYRDLMRHSLKLLNEGKAENFPHAVSMTMAIADRYGEFKPKAGLKKLIGDSVNPPGYLMGEYFNFITENVMPDMAHKARQFIMDEYSNGSRLTLAELIDKFNCQTISNERE